MIPAEPSIADDTVFYSEVLRALTNAGLPFLVGGTYAFNCYAGVRRDTKDLDLFIYRRDYERIASVLQQAGYETELVFPHWLGKVRLGDTHIDLIFSSGNGVAEVDEHWFKHAMQGEVLGVPVKLLPAEEMIWSKAFIMERERYDGADIAHLFRACAGKLDWPRLLERFDPHWRVLLSHFILFGFIYPDERDLIPPSVMQPLLQRLQIEMQSAEPPQRVDNPAPICNGPLLSREQYLSDIEDEKYCDGRLGADGRLTPEDIAKWTAAIPKRDL